MSQLVVEPRPRVAAAGRYPWWHGAAIYQVYPRSFADSNGDGIGDLPGVTAHIDHIARLGVDAIWLSPFFASPMKDFGYDVSDYRAVDPIFGTLGDFDALVARAHGLGLKLLIDQVYSHTSDAHDWFRQSREGRKGRFADWYVWADARADGAPPTNWQSVFGGPAWTWDARRRQYYMHNFLKEQPQLNVHNPEVRDELLATARFWLERGIDGFRLDAVNFTMHDPLLRDNPPAPADGRPRTRPFDYQIKRFNQGHADIPGFIEALRSVVDEHGGFTVAEVGGEDHLREMRLFTAGGNRFHSAYGFDFLYAPALTPELVAAALACWDGQDGWPSWAFENHDAPRAVSRWAQPEQRGRFARVKMLLLAALRGNIILYYGEELGLTQVDIGFDQLQDPEAIVNWPLTLSRDGARTPLPWAAAAPNAGFSSARPWLPIGPDHHALAVDVQEADPGSLLHLTRRCLALRRAHPALRHGGARLLHCDAQTIAFARGGDGDGAEVLVCVFNLSGSAAPWPAAIDIAALTPVMAVGDAAPGNLPAFSGLIAKGPSC